MMRDNSVSSCLCVQLLHYKNCALDDLQQFPETTYINNIVQKVCAATTIHEAYQAYGIDLPDAYLNERDYETLAVYAVPWKQPLIRPEVTRWTTSKSGRRHSL